ncbi:hypothetical protein [Archangium violaceum]|uniref:hypothetical protein n=1 Tax=Archangium violaceum TaxID=83451 RepID=UPI0037BF6839
MPPSAVPSPEGPLPLTRAAWRLELRGPGHSQVTGLATQSRDILAVGSFEGETTLGGQRLVSSGQQDVFVARIDPAGLVRWVRHWGGPGDDLGDAIVAGAQGAFLVTGGLSEEVDIGGALLPGGGGQDCFIAKLALEDGHPQWVRRFGGTGDSVCRSAAFDGSGDVLVTGRFTGQVELGDKTWSSAGLNDLFLLKLSGQDGTLRWARVFGGPGEDTGRDVAVDTAGTAFITGDFSQGVEPSVGTVDFGTGRLSSAGDADAFLAAFSGDGRNLWARAIGGPNFDLSKSVVPAQDGSLYLTGLFQRDVPHQPGQLFFTLGGFEGFVARYSSRGEELWRRRYPTMTSGHALAPMPFGALAMVGHFTSILDLGEGRELRSAGKNDVVVALFGADGEVRWAHHLGGPGQDFGYAVTSIAEGVVAGGMSTEVMETNASTGSTHGFITLLPLQH